MTEREVRISLYGTIGQEAADEAEFVSAHDPEVGRRWFTSLRQAEMVTRCARLARATRTAEVQA